MVIYSFFEAGISPYFRILSCFFLVGSVVTAHFFKLWAAQISPILR
ncbi:hypothetical protein B4168_2167 [Anoxybacillus flavithermus]|nr:hypothetical protein B4168_2167 [Anoxybacillus flavithermus]OAO85823.1 hypothetical protein GT23_2726 [Parageobacillus thermoglucosidasius]